MVADLERKIADSPSSLIGNTGYRRYLKAGQRPEIDWDKVKAEERYDGKWVLTTNTDLPADEVAQKYKELWRVERIFREAKDALKTRPIYHQSDSYILGHVFVSFLALLLMHELKARTGGAFEWDEMKRDLEALYEEEVEQDGKSWLLRSPLRVVLARSSRPVVSQCRKGQEWPILMPRPFSEGEKCSFTWESGKSTVQDHLNAFIVCEVSATKSV